MPVKDLERAIEAFVQPVTDRLPDAHLRGGVRLAVQGISSSQSPLIMQMARGVARPTKTIRAIAKRFYRLLANPGFSHRTLLKGLYAIARKPGRTVYLRIFGRGARSSERARNLIPKPSKASQP